MLTDTWRIQETVMQVKLILYEDERHNIVLST